MNKLVFFWTFVYMPLKLLVVGTDIYIQSNRTPHAAFGTCKARLDNLMLRHPCWISIFLVRISLITMKWGSVLQILC